MRPEADYLLYAARIVSQQIDRQLRAAADKGGKGSTLAARPKPASTDQERARGDVIDDGVSLGEIILGTGFATTFARLFNIGIGPLLCCLIVSLREREPDDHLLMTPRF